MTDRIPLDHLTSDALDALYERLEAAEQTESQRQLATAREAFASATTRAARAEAAIARVRRACDSVTAADQGHNPAVGWVVMRVLEAIDARLVHGGALAESEPEPSDPTQCSGDEGPCPEHGFHQHSLKQPGAPKPAHNDGPSIADCRADDIRWPLEKEGL